MNNVQKIIIICLVSAIVVFSGLIAYNLMKEPVKTVELFENGTTIEVSADTTLKSHDELGNTYVTGKNTTIIGIDDSSLAGALASKVLSELIVQNGEMQDNGVYKLDKNNVKEMADQLGLEYDEDNIKEAFIGIKHNNTVNQSVIIISGDQQEIIDIINSIHWKKGVQSNTSVAEQSDVSASTSNGEKTYPFYADDGSIVGYYHVGDVVEHYDGLYQLKSNGEWVYIGEAKGSSENAYNQGYSDAIDDTYDDADDYDYSDEDYSDYDDEFDYDSGDYE